MDDRAPEIDRAMAVMRQWQRAEPGFRLRQLDGVEAEWAQEDEARAARIAEERQTRERRKAGYDPGLEQARLVLLELEGWLAMEQFQHQGLIDETLLPGMDADGRADRVGECDREIAACQRRLDGVRDAVADPERVVDRDGYLPAERRELSLRLFAFRRQAAVRELRPKVLELSVALDVHVAGRSELRHASSLRTQRGRTGGSASRRASRCSPKPPRSVSSPKPLILSHSASLSFPLRCRSPR